MSAPVWVNDELVLAIHNMLLAEHGGLAGVRAEDMLASALARPRQKAAYDENASIFELAGAYSYGLARNHPFVDGNKRIALTVGAVFLELNGYSLRAPEADAVVIYQQLAAGRLSEEALVLWLQEHSESAD